MKYFKTNLLIEKIRHDLDAVKPNRYRNLHRGNWK